MGRAELLRVVVDTETTGLDPTRDAVVQVALAYRSPHSRKIERWSAECNPGAPFLERGISSGAFQINRRKPEELARALPAPIVAETLHKQLQGLSATFGGFELFCYNLAFDRGFLSRSPWKLDGPWGPCIMKLAHRTLQPNGKWPRLAEACARLGIPYDPEGAHDAGNDAGTALLVLDRLTSFNQDRQPRGQPAAPRRHEP